MDVNCPTCRPRLDNEVICDDCKRVLERGFCFLMFNIMEAGFGVAMGLTAAFGNYVALAIFAFAAFTPVFLAVKK